MKFKPGHLVNLIHGPFNGRIGLILEISESHFTFPIRVYIFDLEIDAIYSEKDLEIIL